MVVALIALSVISVKLVMPTVGQELMPPMDTGAIAIKITTDANLPIEQTQEVMEKINNLIEHLISSTQIPKEELFSHA